MKKEHNIAFYLLLSATGFSIAMEGTNVSIKSILTTLFFLFISYYFLKEAIKQFVELIIQKYIDTKNGKR